MSKAPHIDQATAMMVAATFVEQEDRFKFMATQVPRSCQDKGCALGWIGFVLGMPGVDVQCVAPRLGYRSAMSFYRDMERVCGRGYPAWIVSPTLAATGLRRLARERMST